VQRCHSGEPTLRLGVRQGTLASVALSDWFARKRAKPVAQDSAPKATGSARGNVKPPQRMQGVYSWTLARIRQARDHQQSGYFELPVRLAEAMRTDDALFTAYQARCATQSAIGLSWQHSNTSSNTRK